MFHDANRDGQQDVSEPGLAGWTVYVDLNENRSLDYGEPSVVTKEDDPTTPLVDEAAIIDRFASVDLIVTGPTSTQPSAILDVTCSPARVIRGELSGDLRALLEEE